MKRQNIIGLMTMVSIILVSCFSAIGQVKKDTHQVAVSVIQPDKAKLRFMVIVGNPDHQKVQLRLIKSSYGTIDRKVFRKSQYGMICNLTDADDGEYTIEVRTGKEVIKKAIVLNTVSVLETNRYVSFTNPRQ